MNLALESSCDSLVLRSIVLARVFPQNVAHHLYIAPAALEHIGNDLVAAFQARGIVKNDSRVPTIFTACGLLTWYATNHPDGTCKVCSFSRTTLPKSTPDSTHEFNWSVVACVTIERKSPIAMLSAPGMTLYVDGDINNKLTSPSCNVSIMPAELGVASTVKKSLHKPKLQDVTFQVFEWSAKLINRFLMGCKIVE